MKIAIIKYGMGNATSVKKSLEKLGYKTIITDDPMEIHESDVLLLPGVGSFRKGMENLTETGLKNVLTKEVLENKKPFIGICLGMQLVATYGNEPEKTEGLGWIDGEVKRITSINNLKIPHIGWNTIKTTDSNGLYSEFNNQDFYFIHSFHFVPDNPKEVVITVDYDGEMVAGLKKGNIHVMQFHPEKSQKVGLDMLKKVLDSYKIYSYAKM